MAEDGENNEETLLQESATKEAYHVGRILELQSELKHSRAAASDAQADNEHLSGLLQELREVQDRLKQDTNDLKLFFKERSMFLGLFSLDRD